MSVNVKKPPSPQTLGKHFPGMLDAHRALQRGRAGAARSTNARVSWTSGRSLPPARKAASSPRPPPLAARRHARRLRQAVAITMGNVTSIEVVADALLGRRSNWLAHEVACL